MNNLYEHQKKDRVKWIIVFCALVLLAASVLGVATQGFTVSDPYGWFTKEEKPKDDSSSNKNDASLGEESLSLLEFHNSSLVSLMADEPRAGKVITLKATINPLNSETDGVTWSVDWENPSSEFAKSNGAASSFVRLTPNGLSCGVEAIAPFGEQIVITVQANVNEEAKATCTVDYVAKFVSQSLTASNTHFFQQNTLQAGEHSNVNPVVVDTKSTMISNYSASVSFNTILDQVFTIDAPVTGTVYVQMTDEFYSALEYEGFDFFSVEQLTLENLTVADILNNIGVGQIVPTQQSQILDVAFINSFNRAVRDFGDGVALRLEVHCETAYEEVDFVYSLHFDSTSTVIYPVSMTLDKSNIIL